MQYLLENNADPDIRNRHGERAINLAIEYQAPELCELLAKPEAEEKFVEGIPVGIIETVLPHRSTEEIVFVSWNDRDPSPEMLAAIRKTLPKARTASRMKTLERRPLGAHSWYRDTETDEFGSLIEVSLKKSDGKWLVKVRNTVGPAMAGGGWEGKLLKKYGYWIADDVGGWDE